MTRFIAVISGKGGVGKTTVTLNTGFALSKLGAKVLLLDANLATPNLATHLGIINPEHTLNQFLRKEKSLKKIIYQYEDYFSLIPSSPSYQEYQKTNPQHLSEIFEHVDNLADFVLVDSPSGLGYEVHQVLKNTEEALVVVNPTLSSVMDALKTINLAKENNVITGIILNMSHHGRNELKPKEIEEILGYPILSNLKFHSKVGKALFKQVPIGQKYPFSKPAREFKRIANYLCLKE